MKVMTVFGTRPEGIKMAPLVNCLKNDPEVHHVCVNTAQHRDMLDQVMAIFQISPDYDFNIMKYAQTPETISTSILTELSKVLNAEKPDIVLVHGDTTTAFISSYAAFLKQIPVGHVEAGLRTGNRYSPFPEEMNRKLIDQLATYHFAVTEGNKENLMNEGIDEKNILVTGNTVIDALLEAASKPFHFAPPLKDVVEKSGRILLMTTHRRENLQKLQGVYEAINQIVRMYPDLQVIFPVHKNPLVRKAVEQSLHPSSRIHIAEPLDYLSFAHLMKASYVILTDSGGIQEEAPALGKPVFVARENTERPEGEKAGTIKLAGLNSARIIEEICFVLDDEGAYQKMAQAVNPYGDGLSSQRIKDFLLKTYRSQGGL
ncbi:UDP-N-acetylglucosamine 2-epimerase (non-hydrolyzing) [Bacillus sp. FJAT-42376]|uniref:non-hydrolyzing UDP-N-acetylglucosamine 2-epimerase n=1 Tax=Bacillus sp. FJAT-42376 TaxID=2014076 RepID=UPI000F4D68AF|nr:UDP-N-acetylglucosamine 2-epimerase (non-hydrolyzing) [Bacillus sp. FJAT-42376]AZB43222.1 UDP-N-acetylglucosamine 2-epimerase (non-hydrolyzing) [Bacillus sp. FJAT-42376]